MGIKTFEVDRMSPWEFAAAVKGWNKAHGDNAPEPPTAERFDAVISRLVH